MCGRIHYLSISFALGTRFSTGFLTTLSQDEPVSGILSCRKPAVPDIGSVLGALFSGLCLRAHPRRVPNHEPPLDSGGSFSSLRAHARPPANGAHLSTFFHTSTRCTLSHSKRCMQRITRSKSLYSKEKMRQHRLCHKRILRLRKTDYTAGHLLAAATASRHWRGGDSRDEGGRHRNRHSHRNRRVPGGSNENANATTAPPPVARGASYSPRRGKHSRSVHRGDGGGLGGRGTKSAPRLPSLLDVEDIYGGGSILGSPNLEQCLQAAEMSARSGGCGGKKEGSAAGGSGSRPSSRNSTAGSANHEDDGSRPRLFTDGGVGSRGGSRHHRKSSRQRGGKDTAGVGGSSTVGMRGTDASVGALSYHGESLGGSVEDSSGGTRGGRYGNQRGRGGGGSRGDKSSGSLASSGKSADDAELDKIYNPLAFLDETQGVRVLIQATKPLEVRREKEWTARAACSHDD